MVSVAHVVVKGFPDDFTRTATVLPLFTVPLELVYAPPLMEYMPPVIEMDAAASIPDTGMVLEVITVFMVTFF